MELKGAPSSNDTAVIVPGVINVGMAGEVDALLRLLLLLLPQPAIPASSGGIRTKQPKAKRRFMMCLPPGETG
jgi:hypothetical protein